MNWPRAINHLSKKGGSAQRLGQLNGPVSFQKEDRSVFGIAKPGKLLANVLVAFESHEV
jgi:hypothetical protein